MIRPINAGEASDRTVAAVVKSAPPVQETRETRAQPLRREEPLEDSTAPTPAFLPGEPYGQRSLAGTVHRVTHGQTRLKRLSKHTRNTHAR